VHEGQNVELYVKTGRLATGLVSLSFLLTAFLEIFSQRRAVGRHLFTLPVNP